MIALWIVIAPVSPSTSNIYHVGKSQWIHVGVSVPVPLATSFGERFEDADVFRLPMFALQAQ